MRSAGCVINDWADRDFDGHVQRTKDRLHYQWPFALSRGIVFIYFFWLCSAALSSFLNLPTFLVIALALASLCPFMKRLFTCRN
ncbi:MAG: UbiA family prenyltransferase [Moraxellaceae bacterium]|nr:UbiA family prenyltransferase [Moraxellaceae bacterium]